MVRSGYREGDCRLRPFSGITSFLVIPVLTPQVSFCPSVLWRAKPDAVESIAEAKGRRPFARSKSLFFSHNPVVLLRVWEQGASWVTRGIPILRCDAQQTEGPKQLCYSQICPCAGHCCIGRCCPASGGLSTPAQPASAPGTPPGSGTQLTFRPTRAGTAIATPTTLAPSVLTRPEDSRTPQKASQ